MVVLTSDQAYLAMHTFLHEYWTRGSSPEMATLLGSMALLPDGCPADPAVRADWEAAVSRALLGRADASFKLSGQ